MEQQHSQLTEKLECAALWKVYVFKS